MTNQPHKEIPKLNLQNFSFDAVEPTANANIEGISDKDIIMLLHENSLSNNENELSSFSTLPKTMTSIDSSKKMKKTYTIDNPVNEFGKDISRIVHHLSLAQKYGFFLGIQVVSDSNEKLEDIHRKWAEHSILYSHFSFTQELDETKLLQDLFKGSPQEVAKKVAYVWLPQILEYLHTHDEVYKEEILVEFFMNYKGLTIENVVYALTLALEYNVPIHYSNGVEINSMSLKVLMDALSNPYAFVANLEQMLESNILALNEVVNPLLDMYTPSTNDEMYFRTIDELMNLYVAIKTYFINIFFRKVGEAVYDQFISALTSGKMATFFVPTEVSIIFESLITDIQKQTPSVPNILFSMVDEDEE